MSLSNLILVCVLSFIISSIGILSLSARIVGIRTKKIATSASIFNLIFLISQFANTLQLPILTKDIERSVLISESPNIIYFRLIILCSTFGSIFGAFVIPTMHRFMEFGVNKLYSKNSIFSVLMLGLSLKTFKLLKLSLRLPIKHNFTRLKKYNDLNIGLICLNIIVFAFTTVSVLSCLYAGFINPMYRTTSLSLSGVASSVGVVGMLLFIEPYNSTLTDKVMEGKITDGYFRRHLTYIIIARILGTLLGQLLLIPLANFIAFLAKIL